MHKKDKSPDNHRNQFNCIFKYIINSISSPLKAESTPDKLQSIKILKAENQRLKDILKELSPDIYKINLLN